MPTETTVELSGISLHFELRGSGEPLLLLHGGTGCHNDWAYAGREQLEREYHLIAPDARGHGRSAVLDWPGLPKTLTHRQCALDTLALLDHLGIERCKAIGVSMGGNILLHMASMQPERIEAMVAVSATMYFPEQARKIMAAVPAPDAQPASEWEAMRKRHHLGEGQIRALWEWTRSLKDSYDDMNFTPGDLSAIRARTLIVQGDRDFLYPVEMSVEMYRAIPIAALWIVPNASHGPIFFDKAAHFAETALAFLKA
ncbi:MAG TPA: alpha/beta hydrolase [Candidatus Eisenbacteria bacterium]|nr:alpha/beta hydrolase [Candidatus Eisenbacteria bacterium]